MVNMKEFSAAFLTVSSFVAGAVFTLALALGQQIFLQALFAGLLGIVAVSQIVLLYKQNNLFDKQPRPDLFGPHGYPERNRNI